MTQPTREKILDAVFALVYTKGYNGTSMSMILEACQIPKGSLYHHFSSKKAMVLAVLKERIAPRMDQFYDLRASAENHEIDTIIAAIVKVADNRELLCYGCPLNRLNQEMAPVDNDFEYEINIIYEALKDKLVQLLKRSRLQENVNSEMLSEFIIATVWGALSLSPNHSSKARYLQTISHLIAYLKTLKR
ncbi:MAG: hypothetical protein DSZ03_00465 [Sulfurimonas sp.]|nr:MAG: hypothetical protein DSZ03_00465 [Sulfurimonas sp.]